LPGRSISPGCCSVIGAGSLCLIASPLNSWKSQNSWNSASNKKKYSKLEAERDSLKLKIDEITSDRDQFIKKLEASENETASLEEQLASLSAALQEEIDKSDAKIPPAATPPEVSLSEKTTNKTAGENPLESNTSEVKPD
jgi:chromosome segregation ATPase